MVPWPTASIVLCPKFKAARHARDLATLGVRVRVRVRVEVRV